MQTYSDLSLIECAKRGDLTAFLQFANRHQAQVFHFISLIVSNYEEAEDLTLKIFADAYQELQNLSVNMEVKTWLFKIAIERITNDDNLRGSIATACQKVLAKLRRRLDEPLFVERFAGDAPIEARKITLRSYLALVLLEAERCDYTEISEIMACSTGDVAKHIFQAREEIVALM
ncbi:RNA polymerase sigma factor [Massilia sp. BSC265]|uniref:RNA polymerase sigma factor n=1 Tax=Massilia sp. BSC265 TaxID=1549812 RepID=UPI0009DFC082|nr:sigma factor [Massilia sp. BSC265]